MTVKKLKALIAQSRSASLLAVKETGRSPSPAEGFSHSINQNPLASRLAECTDSQDMARHSLCTLLTQTYGKDEDTLERQLARIDKLCTLFLDLYGDGPVEMLRVPARINIIGEHVDYVSYLPTSSLTFGSREHDMMMLFRPLGSGEVCGASTLPGCLPFRFNLSEAPQSMPGEFSEPRWVAFVFSRPVPEPHWSNYVKGSVFFAFMRFGQLLHRGFCFAVDSTIPPGGGASSSSALTVLAGAAVRRVNHIGFTDEELARDSSRAEWYLGTRGGAMDHNTICLARRQNLVHLSYADAQFQRVPLPTDAFRWVTFYSHSADKSREIMLEYNERAAVSRLIIPALLEDLLRSRNSLGSSWPALLNALQDNKPECQSRIRQVLELLPETVILADMEQSHPETYRACLEAFPALIGHRSHSPLKVRDLALHHLGEISRVNTAVRLLHQLDTLSKEGRTEAVSECLHSLGSLLDQSHNSLRDLYRISTPVVERLLDIIKSEQEVYGARLMGGGFGGNLLALVPKDGVPLLLERVQSRFYGPQGCNGVKEGMVMVSTPGDGLSGIDPESGYRQTIELFNLHWSEADANRKAVCRLLDCLDPGEPVGPIWPVIVAAGKGERARRSGLDVPKPLALVNGVPSILQVLKAIRQSCPEAAQPIVIVSPETEQPIRQLLAGESVTFVTQPEPLGTGDAVFWASREMRTLNGWALVVWSTQPVIRPETVHRTLMLAALFPEYDMVFPTVLIDQPYAPLRRDSDGRILGSQETHLEMAAPILRGETNIGLFLLKSQALVTQLGELRRQYWNSEEGRYNRPRGELGFPNELVTALARQAYGVFSTPLADWREAQGIKSLEDLGRCEQYLSELKHIDS